MSNRAAVWGVLRSLPGPKVRIWGFRWHHGLFGTQLIAAAFVLPRAVRITRPHLIAAGLVLMLHDWHDRSDWFRGRWT